MADIEQLLMQEAGRIGPDIHRRTLNTSPWLKLTKQEVWPDEMGDSISVLVYERSLPSDADGNYTPLQWQNVTANAGTGGNTCLPPKVQLEFGQTKRTYNLQAGAMESPDICVNDLRFAVYRKEQLANIMQILSENTQYVWTERYRDEYCRIAQRKVVAKIDANGNAVEGTDFDVTALQVMPNSILTDGILKRYYMKVLRDGAGANPLSRQNGRPIFGLVLSSEASDCLIKTNDAIRQDFRWSDRDSELLGPLGVERPYGGFFHLIDDFAPRHNLVNTGTTQAPVYAWTRIYPYVSTATTKGRSWDINPVYEAADTEDSVLYHMDVMRSLIPKPITSPGGSTSFDAVNYKGDFKWMNIPNRETNPDKTVGYFRGIYSTGTKPLFPQFGVVIRHLRPQIPNAIYPIAG